MVDTDQFFSPVRGLGWRRIEEGSNTIRADCIGCRNHRQERLHIRVIRVEAGNYCKVWCVPRAVQKAGHCGASGEVEITRCASSRIWTKVAEMSGSIGIRGDRQVESLAWNAFLSPFFRPEEECLLLVCIVNMRNEHRTTKR